MDSRSNLNDPELTAVLFANQLVEEGREDGSLEFRLVERQRVA